MATGVMEEVPAHPFLHEPILYVSNLPSQITDEVIARTLEFCVPFRPRLVRDPVTGNATGSIEFRTKERAEKALATLDGRPMVHTFPQVILHLDPNPPSTSPSPAWPPPSAAPRIVSSLPPNFSDSKLFDAFRGFGAIASCRMHPELGMDVGIVTFWREEDAARAEEIMHMGEVDDNTISVKVFYPPRDSRKQKALEFNPQAPAFVPSAVPHNVGPSGYVPPSLRHASPPLQPFSLSPMPSPHLPLGNHSPMLLPGQSLPLMYSPPRIPLQFPRSPTMSPFVHGPGQQVQFAPPSGPGSTSASGLVDPCNLFCKNLDPSIDSKTLDAHFRNFGQIVSARIMRNEHGQSRGFGFVSYQTPDQAARAMNAMNGATIGSKQIVVRLHEPKQLRKEKLAARFAVGGHGHNGHPRSGATSPTMSEAESAYGGWSTPGIPGRERHRRGSGSYYQAALNGTLHMPLSFDELAGMSPVVRHEVLSGELTRRLRSFPEVKPEEVDGVVNHLLSQSLDNVVSSLHDSGMLLDQIRSARQALGYEKGSMGSVGLDSPSLYGLPHPMASHSTSTLLDPSTLAATASAPEHPSTPVSFAPSVNTPPRTASPTGSIAPGNEKERFLAAVINLEPTRYKADPKKAADITEMLISLSKKERAMCLFSTEYLRVKVENAKIILDTLAEEDEPVGHASDPLTTNMNRLSISSQTPVTPQAQNRQPAVSSLSNTPQTPDLSRGASSTTTSPAPPRTPAGTQIPTSSVYTLASLSKLPASEILRLASSPRSTGLPLPKADPSVVRETDDFVNNLTDKPLAQQKQLLGEKLFKTVKGFGVKNAPKVTIYLLDNEDLRSLAHLMFSYPAVLKEKVLLQTTLK
ncbi:hypothetical protein FRC19_011493 [Serendipita sp. 401]|nr:hypothetical protein FRC19_011493 [Serendipita sp. 401]KAG9054639.1 hypothetical protein FS842_004574 [Serendipita sp. 407]